MFSMYRLVGGKPFLMSSAMHGVEVRLDCPKELLGGKGMDALAETNRVLQDNHLQIESATIMVDRLKPSHPDPFLEREVPGEAMLRYSMTLNTPDGNTIVIEHQAGPAASLDQFMARSLERSLAEYQSFSAKHKLTGKGVVLRNF